MSLRVATDVGGTFTDLVAFDEAPARSSRQGARPRRRAFARGVIDAVEAAEIGLAERVRSSSTAAPS